MCPVNIEVGVLSLSAQIMQLVNQIIYGNIYSDPAEGNTKACKQPQVSQSLREGVLLLHRGGLASFRWVKYVFVIIIAAKQPRNMNSIVIVEHSTVTLICIQYIYIFLKQYKYYQSSFNRSGTQISYHGKFSKLLNHVATALLID